MRETCRWPRKTQGSGLYGRGEFVSLDAVAAPSSPATLVPNFISEDQIEQALLQKLQHIHGYDVLEYGTVERPKTGGWRAGCLTPPRRWATFRA